MNLTGTRLAPTVLRDGSAFAVYRPSADEQSWTLVASGVDEHKAVESVLRGLYGDGLLVLDSIVHLRSGGSWQEQTDVMRSSTPAERLESEIADLEAEAERLRMDAAFGGEWGDRGASVLAERAKALRHALEVLAGS